jgi:hypothetical protein
MTNRRYFLIALTLLACLTVFGCANSGDTSDDDRHGVFYGGVSGGVTRLP